MFKFDFEVEEDYTDVSTNEEPQKSEEKSLAEADTDERPLVEHLLAEMLENIPDDISYSSVQFGNLCIPRRDLFDVRMQLIASEGQPGSQETESQVAIEFAERPSDLVPRVYEGGLKTWECSLDLADHVVSYHSDVGGKRVVELGCGTAIPTLALLQNLLNQPPPGDSAPTTIIHVQDYNASVLEYVTLPNIMLVWFFSAAGESFWATIPPPSPRNKKEYLPNIASLQLDSVPEEAEEEEETETTPYASKTESLPHAFDPSVPGDLATPPALRSAFLASLRTYKIDIRFFSGPWSKFHPHVSTRYDLILTSETIYQPASLPSLVKLLRDVIGTGVCLVAAKLVYFGVGGGIKEFERALGEGDVKGRTETVWEHKEGVGRCILRVDFGR